MSLSVGDILKITDYQSFFSQLTENVFFYRVTAVPDPDADLTVYETIANAFRSNVILFELNLQNAGLHHTSVRVDNLTNGIDFGETAGDVAGLLTGDPMASFMALNFILRRSTGITRNGSKRFGGLDESSISGNSWTGSGSALTNMGTALASPLLHGTPVAAPFADPVIVGRKLVGAGTPSEHYELDLTKINPVASAAFTAVSSQRSRKVGHGI